MTTAVSFVFFVFGMIIGSFLNVVILRYNTHRSYGGRSGCMVCSHKLSWYELIPVFSFVGLGGRCKNCKTGISMQYPLVELSTALIFAGIFLKFKDLFYLDTISFSLTFAYYAVAFSLLMVICVYDLKHKIIPDVLSLVFGIFTFVGLFLITPFGFSLHIPALLDFLSGIFISVPFALMWLLSRGTWMGLGDAKLAIGLGWLLGFSQIISATVLAFWSGAVVGLFLIFFSKKYKLKSEVPFAPFLVLGTIIVFLFGLHFFPFGI